MISIHRHMLFILLTAFFLVWMVAVGFTTWNTRHRIEQVLDAQLVQGANFLWLRVKDARDRGEDALAEVIKDTERTFSRIESFTFQVWDGRSLILKSANAPNERMSSRPGTGEGTMNGGSWRYYYRVDAFDGFDVIVGVEDDFSGDVVKAVAIRYTWPMLLAMPFVGLAIFYGVTRGLAPLRELATQITERSPYQMSPIDAAKVPQEVEGIVMSLNNLLARLEEAIEGERRFTANASHELRTPLAAIHVQCQVALRATDSEERDRALQQISQSVDRATRMVAQLLTLARLDPDTVESILKPINLRRLLEEEVAEVSPSALEKKIDIGLECPDDVTITADSESLFILARNLLDNAIRYTPEGGGVTTVVEQGDDEVRLSVTDTGPGIAPEERDKVLDRFYRIVGSASSGAGLGLSIVNRIVEMHGARLELSDNGPHGLKVTVIFPREHSTVST